jgi:hypothetical protein
MNRCLNLLRRLLWAVLFSAPFAASAAQPVCHAWALVERASGEAQRAWLGDGSAWERLGAVRQDLHTQGQSPSPGLEPRLRTPFLRSLDGLLERAGSVRKAQAALLRIQAAAPDGLQRVEAVQLAQAATPAGPVAQHAAGQLAVLTQRLGRVAGQWFVLGPIDPDAVFLLGRDTRSFTTLLKGLLQGDPALALKPVRDRREREALLAVQTAFEPVAAASAEALADLQQLVAAREALQQLHSMRMAWAGPMGAACARP